MDVKEYAVIVFCDKEKRILLQDRKGISKYGEEWGFFGGKLEGSETPEAGIIRETKEELDYDLASFKFFTRVQAPSASGRGMRVNQAFLAEFPGSEKLRQLEGTGMRFFSVAEAKKLKMTPISYLVLNALGEYFEKG